MTMRDDMGFSLADQTSTHYQRQLKCMPAARSPQHMAVNHGILQTDQGPSNSPPPKITNKGEHLLTRSRCCVSKPFPGLP